MRKDYAPVTSAVRMLRHDLGVRSSGVPFKVLWGVLAMLVPKAYVSHMVVAVAHRRDVRAA